VLPYVALVAGALVGFIGSRQLRRPDRAAHAASVARNVGGNLGRRKGLTAPELQRACFSEMVRHVRVGRDGRSQAPARYRLLLHPDDLATVDDARSWFTDGLTEALLEAASTNGWKLDGRVDITYEADSARRPGAPSALAIDASATKRSTPSGPPPSPPPTSGPAVALRRSDTGERVVLTGEKLTIGRSKDNAIVIDDNRVSRAHAALAPGRGGWTITDLGSSNGTSLNGRLLSPKVSQPIAPGDAIAIGPIELEVQAAPPRPVPGTRALDDRERTRISGEVLPPPRRPRP